MTRMYVAVQIEQSRCGVVALRTRMSSHDAYSRAYTIMVVFFLNNFGFLTLLIFLLTSK